MKIPRTAFEKVPIAFDFVETVAELGRACEVLKSASVLAIDTEFVGEKYFYASLEVVQISDGENIFVIDAKAVGDLRALGAVVCNSAVLKLLHAAGQDLEILKRAFGCTVAPYQDLQLAAAFAGYGGQVSLANLVAAEANVELSGKQTTSDWGARPLTQEQLIYGAADVRYLHEIYANLKAKLTNSGRWSWFEEEQARVVARTEDDGGGKEAWQRVKDALSLHPKELVILRELANWREETAKRLNQPRRVVMTDEGLIEIARFQPKTKEKALLLRRVHGGQISKHFSELLTCINRGLAVDKEDWPQKPQGERVDMPKGIVELCQALLRNECDEHDVASTLLATTSQLQSLLAARKTGNDTDSPLLSGWRGELVGHKLLALLDGRMHVYVGPDGALVFEDR